VLKDEKVRCCARLDRISIFFFFFSLLVSFLCSLSLRLRLCLYVCVCIYHKTEREASRDNWLSFEPENRLFELLQVFAIL